LEIRGLLSTASELLRANKFAEALATYDQALIYESDNAEAQVQRANCLYLLGRKEEAIEGYEKSITLLPGQAAVYFNFALALAELGRFKEALDKCDKALARDPHNVDALECRGYVLNNLRRFEESLACYNQVLNLRRGTASTYYHRGNALGVLKQFEAAARDAESALRLDPDYPYARSVLIQAKLSCCQWTGLAPEAEAAEAALGRGEKVLSPFDYLALCPSAAQQRRCAEIWATNVAPSKPEPMWQGKPYGHKQIRLGYLSADFRLHPVASLMAGIFEAHDRSKFETFALSFTPEHQSPLRARLEESFEHFLDVREMTDEEIARMIRDKEIDILVDLMGFTRECRTGILAHRPAPVQVNFLGYPATMAAPYMDYIIADAIVIPESHKAHYAEKIVHLPDSYLPHDSMRAKPGTPPSRKIAGLPETGFVFCSFNGAYKYSPHMFDVWMRCLSGVEKSVLWLQGQDQTTTRNLRSEAAARGVDPKRLVFAPYVPDDSEHLARMQLADLFLDTSPYGAHTSASDALWAGIPVLTFPGETFAGRVATSLLSALGLTELVANSIEDYETKAVQFGQMPETLVAVRKKLLAHRITAPLFDTTRFCRNLESAFVAMNMRVTRGEPAQDLVMDGAPKK
jgi:predicted O-linked N-acetylglucosamine transferase (SPINDLY family)